MELVAISAVVLAAVALALLVDHLKRTSQLIREENVELRARLEVRAGTARLPKPPAGSGHTRLPSLPMRDLVFAPATPVLEAQRAIQPPESTGAEEEPVPVPEVTRPEPPLTKHEVRNATQTEVVRTEGGGSSTESLAAEEAVVETVEDTPVPEPDLGVAAAEGEAGPAEEATRPEERLWEIGEDAPPPAPEPEEPLIKEDPRGPEPASARKESATMEGAVTLKQNEAAPDADMPQHLEPPSGESSLPSGEPPMPDREKMEALAGAAAPSGQHERPHWAHSFPEPPPPPPDLRCEQCGSRNLKRRWSRNKLLTLIGVWTYECRDCRAVFDRFPRIVDRLVLATPEKKRTSGRQ